MGEFKRKDFGVTISSYILPSTASVHVRCGFNGIQKGSKEMNRR
jgi:hypothetical protein